MIIIKHTMLITGTHIVYLNVCKCKLWLYANGISMEHTSDLVAEGKLIGENSYSYISDKYKEIEIEGSKIDRFDAKNKIIYEVKKSNKKEDSHIAQLKYYMYLLQKNGIEIKKAVLEYPKLRETNEININEVDNNEIENWLNEIQNIIKKEECPPKINKKFCKSCSYFDFCYVNDDK